MQHSVQIVLLVRYRTQSRAHKILARALLRAVLPREPDDDLLDDGEQYYRILPEGEFLEWDGFTQTQGTRWGLDANRHFPHGFRPEGGQNGAGPHPMFLEVRGHKDARVYLVPPH